MWSSCNGCGTIFQPIQYIGMATILSRLQGARREISALRYILNLNINVFIFISQNLFLFPLLPPSSLSPHHLQTRARLAWLAITLAFQFLRHFRSSTNDVGYFLCECRNVSHETEWKHGPRRGEQLFFIFIFFKRIVY